MGSKKSRASVEPVDTGKSLGIPTEGKEAADEAVLRLGDFNYPFRWCPAGKFTMGSPISEQGRHIDENQHEVDLTHGFWMLETEVTLKMFSQFVRETGYVTEAEKDELGGYAIDAKTGMFLGPDKKYNWKNTGLKQTRDFPVVNVTWNDAQAFVAWMNKKFSDIAGVPQPALNAALPTEAQWEYACRAGHEHAFGEERDQDYMKDFAHLRSLTTSRKMNTLWGMDNLPWVILADQPNIFTEPAGSYKPNAWGLFDMHGNVWEWCQDWHENFDVISVVDPQGAAEGESRVLRGGAWDTDYAYARCAARAGNVPSRRFVTLGFRIVLNPFVQPEPEEKEKVEMSEAEKFYEYYDTRLDREKTELHRHNRHVERDFDSDEIHSWDREENKNLEPYRIPNDPYDRPLPKPQGWNVNY